MPSPVPNHDLDHWVADAHERLTALHPADLNDTLFEFVHHFWVSRRKRDVFRAALQAYGYETVSHWQLGGFTLTAVVREVVDPLRLGELESVFAELLSLTAVHAGRYGGWELVPVRRWRNVMS